MNKSVAAYDKNAKAFADKWDRSGARIKDIEKGFSFANKKKPRVIELGCGNGRDAAEILKRTPHYIGIDAAPKLLEISRRKSPNADFRLATFEEFDLPENSADIVFAFASLIHCDKVQLRKILEKAHKWLTKGGIFYISLKAGPYGRVEITDETGTRENIVYQPEDVQELSSDLYETVEVDRQNLRGQDLFTIILRKS